MNEKKTISQVVGDGLCIGCGTCVSMCIKEAVELRINEKKGIYIPEIDIYKCHQCGICYQVCLGHEVDFKELNQVIFGKEPENILIGNYLNCYIGHSTDCNIRYNSASGGLVTQLLIFALEERIIDGALVTRMKRNKPLEPEPFIARTKEEIIKASKSKYCPVPANIALKEILESGEGEKFAVVGLPCHIHGIRKAEQINKKLKKKIVLHLGLFCNHTPTFAATELFLKKLKIKKEDVKSISYRGEGWPGKMKITTKNSTKLISLPEYWDFIGSYAFYPKKCLFCSDAFAELADISFGDAWLSEYKGDKIGTSIIISRNIFGNETLNKAKNCGKIQLSSTSCSNVILSNLETVYRKKKYVIGSLKIFEIIYYLVMRSNILHNFFKKMPMCFVLCLDACLNKIISKYVKIFMKNHESI